MKRLIPFEKYQATGNDFIILDFFNFEFIDLADQKLIQTMCHRHFGIGADGLIALLPSKIFDFNMVYFNSDGNISSFCGNGSRASVQYMHYKQGKTEFSFEAFDGPHRGLVQGELVKVKMKDIEIYQDTEFGLLVDSGSPHLIVEVKDPFEYDVNLKGRILRNKFGPEGVNVNFINAGKNQMDIATYERGVEEETLACGTGIVASSYYVNLKNKESGHSVININSKGGNLKVEMYLNKNKANEIWLTGPAVKVFSGFYTL